LALGGWLGVGDGVTAADTVTATESELVSPSVFVTTRTNVSVVSSFESGESKLVFSRSGRHPPVTNLNLQMGIGFWGLPQRLETESRFFRFIQDTAVKR